MFRVVVEDPLDVCQAATGQAKIVLKRAATTHGESVVEGADMTEVWLRREQFEVRPADPTLRVNQREILTLSNEVRGL